MISPSGLLAGRVMAVNSVGGGHVAEGAGGNSVDAGCIAGRSTILAVRHRRPDRGVGERMDTDRSAATRPARRMSGASLPQPIGKGVDCPARADDAYLRLGGTINLDINDTVRNLFVGDSTTFRTGDPTESTAAVRPPSTSTARSPSRELSSKPAANWNPGISSSTAPNSTWKADWPTFRIRSPSTRSPASAAFRIWNGRRPEFAGQQRAHYRGQWRHADHHFQSTPAPCSISTATRGNGEVRATAGNLVFSANVDPNFAGDMEIGGGHEITIDNAWTLSPGGTLTLDGNTTSLFQRQPPRR